MLTGHRPATCAERRRLSVMARCPHVHIVRTTRQSAYSHRWRRNASRRKGACAMAATAKYLRLIICSAKYIEGLENRLARMESLMRLSGVLPEDDDGSTDLATIEKRLADRAGRSATPRQSMSEDRRQSMSIVPQSGTSTNDGTPAQPTLPSPRSGTASPEPETQEEGEGKGKDGEDALAEMMCSLVTNNYGETRYIGESLRRCCMDCAKSCRFFVRVLHLLAEGHPVGERKDRRQLFPAHDLHSSCRR